MNGPEEEYGADHGTAAATTSRPVPSPSPDQGSYPRLSPPVEPLPILAILPERRRQRRWTVLLRAVLALPLALVVLVVDIATFVCVVLGWFAALATGRTPGFVRTMVTMLLRLVLRLEAYTYLLTDRFPPFAARDVPGSGTSLLVPPATKLNRAAVLFRLVLVIPASIALRITGLGLQVVAVVMWFVVLITGWLPKPVHEAYQVFIRYELRFIGYLSLLVPTYPGELFGDLPVPAAALVPGAVAPEPIAGGPDQEAPPAPPWMLILGMGAKRLLVVCIVLGVAAAAGLGLLEASIGNHENLVQVNNQLVTNLNGFATTAKDCQSVSCLEQADGALSRQLGSFVSALESSNGGGVSQSTIDEMTAAAQNAQRVSAALSEAAPTESAYQALVKKLEVEQVFTRLARAQQDFVQAVNAARFG